MARTDIGLLFYSLFSIIDATTVSYFTSTDCTTDLIAEEEYFYGCAYKVEDYYYAPQYYSVDVQCSDEASNIPPLPKYDGSYALNRYVTLIITRVARD